MPNTRHIATADAWDDPEAFARELHQHYTDNAATAAEQENNHVR